MARRPCAAQRAVNAKQASERRVWNPSRPAIPGTLPPAAKRVTPGPVRSVGVLVAARQEERTDTTRDARSAGNPGNVGGGKESRFRGGASLVCHVLFGLLQIRCKKASELVEAVTTAGD